LLLNRPSSRSVASLEKLKAAVPDGKFVPIDCDLQDFASVRKAAGEIKDKYTDIFCLSNNAGIMMTPDEITVDGYDKQMQTNHLSHFLLTKELFPLLLKSSKGCGDARIVQHSSMARDMTVNKGLEDKYLEKQLKNGMLGGDEKTGFMNPKDGPAARYSQTKLANSVFAQALHDRLTKSQNKDCGNVLSLCAHPGGSSTNLANDLADTMFKKVLFGALQKLVFQSPADGAMGLIKTMMEPKEKLKGGTLYGPKGMTGYAFAMPSASYETDPKSMDMLWKKSEDAIGGSFDL
jgi:NAD(P)-dependent dehydrogenase (short-subunit alcohol dehydrogenase family)